MTGKKPSDILKSCGTKIRDLIRMQNERETMAKSLYPRAIIYSHDKIISSQKDYFGNTFAKVVDMEIDIKRQAKIVRQMRMLCLDLIDTLQSANQRYVLTQYYTELHMEQGGKQMTWYTLDDIANEMGLTTTAVKKIKERGLFFLDRHHDIVYFDIM